MNLRYLEYQTFALNNIQVKLAKTGLLLRCLVIINKGQQVTK